MKQLILGGARSGKSRLAEQLTALSGERIAYLATTDARHNDQAMDERIEKHRRQRPNHWQTIEEPIELAAALQRTDDVDAILVDCLTLWLSNCMMQDGDCWQQQRTALIEQLQQQPVPVIFVSNEVGLGVVPMGKLSRRFVDEAGLLHQQLAQLCDRVVFTAAGLPLVMKGPPLPENL